MKRTRVRKLERVKKDEKEQMTWAAISNEVHPSQVEWVQRVGMEGSERGDSKVEANEKLRTVKVKLLSTGCRVCA